MSLRGSTFSPAEDWFAGGPEFAAQKLEEVAAYLDGLAIEADQGSRRKRRKNSQRVFDLEDAATTLRDCRRYLFPR